MNYQYEKSITKTWSTPQLAIPNGPSIFFLRPVTINIAESKEYNIWTADIPELDACENAADIGSAIHKLIETLRIEASGLIHAFTHRLSKSDRERKQLLLGTIDIVRSALHAAVPEEVWALGAISSFEGKFTFRITSDRTCHSIPMSEAEKVGCDNSFRLAKFKTDSVGRPIGPVISLSDSFDSYNSNLLNHLNEMIKA